MFEQLMKERFSVRNYSDQMVEEDKLQKILEAGRLAPTAANKQPQKIYVLKSQEVLEKARGFTHNMFNAPIALLICYDEKISWKATKLGEDYDGGEVDAAIITTSMMMEATELGLGTLWVRGFHSQKAAELFELPSHIHLVCFLLIGYPAQDAKPTANHENRRDLSEIVEYL